MSNYNLARHDGHKIRKINRVLDYIRGNWIARPDLITLSGAPITTNNWSETFNANLKRNIKVKSCGMWIFLEHLNNIITNYITERERTNDIPPVNRNDAFYTNSLVHVASIVGGSLVSDYSDQDNSQRPNCPICLNYIYSDPAVALNRCGHTIHEDCWNTLIAHNPGSGCPVCNHTPESTKRIYSLN